ncbi:MULTISPECIES: ferredoxin reductase family protein [Thalassospira]|uniref:Iron reductase n=2 Tax=Thalassospira tepidiphila TaxID=393657 RepID=A0A853L439_9PROT|nr:MULTISPECIES: ferric reductase-like transmembrane domain-containing protein [Thalassospira]NJB73745.1 putative ferric reductase [Thalassospira tepidiphila]OAZ12078.1 iron reductase [Thalassospira tepidiphila MCCC 1A03514]QPO11359.1 ferric reductase-like transmembrane domain-containing protein [Thalassospira sp. A40-3]
MRTISKVFVGFVLAVTGIWLVSNPDLFAASSFISLRHFMVQYSGFLAISMMSLILLLSVRPVWLTRRLGGLDKAYRQHKWLGIAVLVVATLHWAWRMAPKWGVALGLLERGRRGPRPDGAGLHWAQSLFNEQRGLAETVGEWAFYVAVALILIALIKRIPYRWFARTHTVLAVIYLVLVYHSIVLLDFTNWATPVGYVLAVMLLVGTVSSIIVLFGQIGAGRRSTGEVIEVDYLPEMKSLQIAIRSDGGWKGHLAGQFAFVRFGNSNEAHPFTIASAWRDGVPGLTIIAKKLGDYTNTLYETLKPGDRVALEGPYGTFVLDREKLHQIWISGGIGLTPFVAWLEDLVANPAKLEIDFYQVAPHCDPELMARINDLAGRAGVRLREWRDARDGFLTGEKIRSDVAHWQEAQVWFCGPRQFGEDVKNDLVAAGLHSYAFHQELFDFR